MEKENTDILKLAMDGRKNNTYVLIVTNNLSNLDKKLIAQCRSIVPLLHNEMVFIVSTYLF